MSLDQYEFDRSIEISLCMNYLKQYNELSKNKIDENIALQDLNKMNLKELELKTNEIYELLDKRKTSIACDKLFEEIKIHGAEYVKEKYLSIET